MSEWISVKDRLPEKGTKVLCYRPMAEESNDEKISVRMFDDMERMSWQGVPFRFQGCCHVSHWMPLPKPPITGE